MKKQVRIINTEGRDLVMVSSVEELEKYSRTYSIYPVTPTVYYGEPFNVEISLDTNANLNTVFPSLYLVNNTPFSYFIGNSFKDLVYTAVQLQFELEENGLITDIHISQGINSTNNLQLSSHPLSYITRAQSFDVRRALVILGLLKLKRDDLVEKYKSLLENSYCTIKETKELVSIMEEIDGILA